MRLFSALSIILVLNACQPSKTDQSLLIQPNQIGLLQKDTPIYTLDSIFKNDSVVKRRINSRFSSQDEFIVYSKEGRERLVLIPKNDFDSTSTVANIQIKDSLFHTAKGISIQSTFRKIQEHYKISRIENTLRTAVIFLNEQNLYLSIDKEFVSGDAKYNTNLPIAPSQIQDQATIKHLYLGWD
ncbi:hypothetical protein ACFSQ0_01920 [Mesonia sediminis]|uniref:DUF4292 domain-containing protein n=1 Tax=Mesonia sediminis TaxID=1703946 RepID=A0ABW5SBI8_9FLAO